MLRWLCCALAVVVTAATLRSQEPSAFDRTRDVIYGRKFGTALTMDVLTPKDKANGAAVVVAVSGGWKSRPEDIDNGLKIGFGGEFLKRGYTVFGVVHGSQPKFTIPEAIADMQRAVRFIRHNARNYRIDPDRIGITGGSSGCHLSLMVAVSGTDGDPKARDPVDRSSSRVQAVAGFFPPTDFFNYGGTGKTAELLTRAGAFGPAFDFRERDVANVWKPVSDEKRKDLLKQISPIYHVTRATPPVLLIHGDLDILVPLQQSQIFIDKLKEHNVPCELVVHKGGGHAWPGIDKEFVTFANWFDKYLAKKN